MIIKYNHITKKRLILLVILMALILMPSIKSYAASTTNTTINKNNTYTNGSKYTAVCKDLAENSDLYCVEESQTKPWGNNPQQVVTYECIGSVDVDTRRKSNIVKKTGKCTAITNDECLKIAYALATKSKYYSTYKKMIEDNFDFNTYKGSYQFPDYHRAIAKNPWTAIIWDLHGASKLQGTEKYIEVLSYFEPKNGYGSIGALLGISAVIADVEENALTMEEINARTEIKEIQTTVKTYYNIEEENQNLANKIKELPNKSKPSEYIVIGPYKYEASKGDYISNIQVKKNGQNNYEEIHESIINPSKILVLSKQLNGEYKITYSDTEKRIGYDILPEFYVLVKKDSNIRSIDDLKVTIGRKNYEAKWYYFKGTNPSQALMTGNGKLHEDTKSLNYKVNLIPPVQVELDKVDTAGDAVEGAKFSIEYSNGLKGETKTVGKDGKIVFSQVQPTSPDEFTATITETFTPAGYKKLEKPIVLKFTYDQNKAVWKVEKISGPDEKITIGTVTKDSKSGINKIPVTVENKSIIEKLTLLKTSSVGGGKVEGAKFKLTLTNIASIKGYKIPTTGTPTIIVTTDKNGNIVLEDIEIADLSKDIVITMEETEAPVGYKKIEGKITVTLKRKGNTYTIHKAEKEDTVTDDEFEAGEVTLKNHELELKIKDIPVMNLGGIVWTEKIKTGKEQPDINNTYSESDDEALGGVEVRLLDGNNNVIATTTTAKQDGEKVTYLNNLGKEVTVELKQGQYLFTKLNKLNNGTNYIPVRTDYKVEIDYDGITYNPLMNTDANILYNKNAYSKITSEDDHGLADGTKTISGTENKEQSTTNGDYTINYTLQDEEKIPDKAIYSNVEKDGDQVFVTARSEKYLQKTEDWESIWKDNNGVGEINLDSYVFDINFGLYKKFFDLNLGTDVDSAEIEINGQKTAYTYDQILDGMLDKDLREKLYKTTDDKVDYNLYLAYSDYYYRIDDYKVPDSTDSLGQPYGEALPGKKDENTELQVYVTYTLQINNQSTQHNATGVKVKYSYDDGYEYVGSNGEATVNDEGHNILTISNINNVVPGEKPKEITLKFKVKKNEDGTFFKTPSDTSKYTNVAEIVEYSTTEGRLVDADSAPGNTFLGENKPTDRREDDTDTANGIVITFKKNAERSISGKVFDASNNNGVSDVIVQLIELVEINNKQQYEYIWQETVAGSNTVKTTATSGGRGETYNVSNSDGEYKFTQRIIPGNYIVRFIYGDGSTYDITKNTLKYNGEDYKSTYVDYNYNAEWYNDTKIGEKYLYDEKNNDISKAVDNEARRLKVMSYAVDVDGTKGKKLDLLDADIEKLSREEKATLEEEVIPSTWMCAETLKIKMPVDTDIKDNTSDTTEVGNGSSPTISNTQFNNVNFGLMERPKTKLVLEKHITGLTVKPVASGVNLIANATADINKILDQGEGDQIQLEGQRDGLSATKSGRTNRGLWYLQTDTTELAQGADAYITYTYVIKNEGEQDYLSASLIEKYREDKDGSYKAYLETLEGIVKEQIKSKGFTKGEYLSGSYYRKNDNAFTPTLVQASVEKLQEALNPKVKFVNSTTDFSKTDRNSNIKYAYYDTNGNMQENDSSINEIITSTKGTGKMELNGRDTSKKLVVSVGLSASEIENGGVYDSYIAQVTHYTNAAGRRDQSTPANLSYVHSEDTGITLDKYNEEDEFWAETFRITKPTGEDKITPVQIAIITISAVAVLGVGIILIKKFVLKK